MFDYSNELISEHGGKPFMLYGDDGEEVEIAIAALNMKHFRFYPLLPDMPGVKSGFLYVGFAKSGSCAHVEGKKLLVLVTILILFCRSPPPITQHPHLRRAEDLGLLFGLSFLTDFQRNAQR